MASVAGCVVVVVSQYEHPHCGDGGRWGRHDLIEGGSGRQARTLVHCVSSEEGAMGVLVAVTRQYENGRKEDEN